MLKCVNYDVSTWILSICIWNESSFLLSVWAFAPPPVRHEWRERLSLKSTTTYMSSAALIESLSNESMDSVDNDSIKAADDIMMFCWKGYFTDLHLHSSLSLAFVWLWLCMTEYDFGEHLTRDQKPFLHTESHQFLQISLS